MNPMPRDGSLTPADLIGKLETLVVQCDKCGSTQYRIGASSVYGIAAIRRSRRSAAES